MVHCETSYKDQKEEVPIQQVRSVVYEVLGDILPLLMYTTFSQFCSFLLLFNFYPSTHNSS